MQRLRSIALAIVMIGALVGVMTAAPPKAQATEVVNCLSNPDPITVTRGVGPGQSTCFGGAGEYGFSGGYPDVFQIITGDYQGWITYGLPDGRSVTQKFEPQKTIHFDPKIKLYTLEVD